MVGRFQGFGRLVLLTVVLVLPVAAAGHLNVSGTAVLDCTFALQVGGVAASDGCFLIKKHDVATPDGSTYRLQVDWTPAGPEWNTLRIRLVSCDPQCGDVVVNNAGVVQQAEAVVPAPTAVLTIPTNGPEQQVGFVVRPAQSSVSVFHPNAPQSVAFALTHV